MTYTFKYEGHDIRFQHVVDCVQLLVDGSLVAEQTLQKDKQWDDFELQFPVSFG